VIQRHRLIIRRVRAPVYIYVLVALAAAGCSGTLGGEIDRNREGTIVVAAVYGERTDEIAERLESCAAGTDVLVVQGGINDIAQGYGFELAVKSLRAMVRRGKELGLRVTIANVLPWNAGWPRTEEAINRLNEQIEELAQDESVSVLPFYATLESPNAPGRMREEWTSDGDHPSVEGYRRLGELAFHLP
jgi:lysophospholipase L1-like esterase